MRGHFLMLNDHGPWYLVPCSIYFTIFMHVYHNPVNSPGNSTISLTISVINRQRALRKRNFVVMGFVIKVLWQDHTFVMKCTLNALCLM